MIRIKRPPQRSMMEGLRLSDKDTHKSLYYSDNDHYGNISIPNTKTSIKCNVYNEDVIISYKQFFQITSISSDSYYTIPLPNSVKSILSFEVFGDDILIVNGIINHKIGYNDNHVLGKNVTNIVKNTNDTLFVSPIGRLNSQQKIKIKLKILCNTHHYHFDESDIFEFSLPIVFDNINNNVNNENNDILNLRYLKKTKVYGKVFVGSMHNLVKISSNTHKIKTKTSSNIMKSKEIKTSKRFFKQFNVRHIRKNHNNVQIIIHKHNHKHNTPFILESSIALSSKNLFFGPKNTQNDIYKYSTSINIYPDLSLFPQPSLSDCNFIFVCHIDDLNNTLNNDTLITIKNMLIVFISSIPNNSSFVIVLSHSYLSSNNGSCDKDTAYTWINDITYDNIVDLHTNYNNVFNFDYINPNHINPNKNNIILLLSDIDHKTKFKNTHISKYTRNTMFYDMLLHPDNITHDDIMKMLTNIKTIFDDAKTKLKKHIVDYTINIETEGNFICTDVNVLIENSNNVIDIFSEKPLSSITMNYVISNDRHISQNIPITRLSSDFRYSSIITFLNNAFHNDVFDNVASIPVLFNMYYIPCNTNIEYIARKINNKHYDNISKYHSNYQSKNSDKINVIIPKYTHSPYFKDIYSEPNMKRKPSFDGSVIKRKLSFDHRLPLSGIDNSNNVPKLFDYRTLNNIYEIKMIFDTPLNGICFNTCFSVSNINKYHRFNKNILTSSVNEFLGGFVDGFLSVGDYVVLNAEKIEFLNGVYMIFDIGSESSPWILLR